jgi:hypothetical protein
MTRTDAHSWIACLSQGVLVTLFLVQGSLFGQQPTTTVRLASSEPVRSAWDGSWADRNTVPADFAPWWQAQVQEKLSEQEQPLGITQDALLLGALRHSHQIRVFTDLPLIRETAIQEAYGEFDWRKFLETRWRDTSDPVGNTLVTGGPDRFRDNIWTGDAGFRRRNQHGGRLELRQQIGHQDNNSVFFVPQNQGTSRLVMSYTQPLLNGRGEVYNTSLQHQSDCACRARHTSGS